IAFLLVSRLPVWSGKSENSRVRRDLVLPAILGVVFYVATLMTYTWETMAVTALGYLITLPFGARSWPRKYGGDWPVHPSTGGDGLPGDKD
ncbi:MAG: CDP-diacylglycerol--serine O-phosphatidyltransferase, partial [Ensifer adhaerens]|nr:CDP-diacylglycerol--serine O-phosphatidyltransferase [Ensifer adhaerens]